MLKCYKESKENVEDLKGMLHEVYLCIRFKYIPTLVPPFGSCAHSNPKFPSGGPSHRVPCRVWVPGNTWPCQKC
jgi:hypothetical protein